MTLDMPAAPLTETQARRLIADVADALDAGDIERWPSFFADPCLYRITTRQNEEANMPLSIMLCDSPAMLYDRVEAILHANIFEPHHNRHVLSDSRYVERGADAMQVTTSFMCVRTMVTGGAMTLFAAGRYIDEIVRVDGACRFRSRTVVLDASQVDTLLAIPL